MGGSASTALGAIAARSRPGRGALLVLLLLGLLLSAPAAAKPRHHHKCKRSQATVKVNGKRRCKPLRSVFPKPRAGDERIAAWKTALSPPSGVRDRRGRKLISLLRGHGSAGRKLYAALSANMSAGLTRLDALDEPAPRPRAARAGAAGSGCGGSPIPRKESFVSGKVGGVSVSGDAYSSPSGKSLVFRAKSGDKFVRTSVEDFNCHNTPPPSCPTAAGAIDSRSSGRERITFLYFEDGELVASTISTTETTTITKGRTAEDARLDYLDIDYTVHATLKSGPASAMTTESSTEKREVRVSMRARPESYAPGSASLSSTGAKLAEIDEKTFAALVGNRVATYRSLEVGGGFADTPGKCAELKFTPASDTLKLKKGQTGTVDVRVESNGTAENPRATAAKSAFNRTGQDNATITPGQAEGKVVPFKYTVTKAGPGVKVKASFKATSTAGLAAEASWTQPTDAEAPVKRISGTFSGSANTPESGNFDWQGTITFTRDSPDDPGAAGSYTLSSADYDLTASGRIGPAVNNCAISGSKHFHLVIGERASAVTGSGPTGEAPYTYNLYAVPDPQTPITITYSSCTYPQDNGKTQDYYPLITLLGMDDGTGPPTSADGLTYAGSASVPGTTLSQSWTWSLHGETS